MIFATLFLVTALTSQAVPADQEDLKLFDSGAEALLYNYGGSTGVSRSKRQLFGRLVSMCPDDRAEELDQGRTRIIMISPLTKRDTLFTYRDEGWTKEDIKQLLEAGFNSTKPTFIYSFGFTQNSKSTWLLKLRNLYFKLFRDRKPSFNLLIFDWSRYSRFSYTATVSYVPHLSEILANFLEKIATELSYDMGQVHLVGYSLSSHILGHTAKLLSTRKGGKIGQLTLIDPTGVCFHEDTSKFAAMYSVKPSAAKLTVAKHYDMNNLGAKRSIGHVDIYVNGGSNQPGSTYITRLVASHEKAIDHETLGLTPNCQQVAYACDDYESYAAGECASCGSGGELCYYINTFGRALIGQKNNSRYKQNTNMYFKTDFFDRCIPQYQLKMVLKKEKEFPGIGNLELKVASAQLKAPSNSIDGRTYTSLITALSLPNIMQQGKSKVALKLVLPESGKLNGIQKYIERVEFNYMSHSDPRRRRLRSGKFCSTDKTENDLTLVRCD